MKKRKPSTGDGMDAFVEQLRKEYGLDDPRDLSPKELKRFREETAGIRRAVVTSMSDGLRSATGKKPRRKRWWQR